jgi:hypothetical protein
VKTHTQKYFNDDGGLFRLNQVNDNERPEKKKLLEFISLAFV